MASYLPPIIIFAIAGLLVVLDRRNGKTLGPELYSEYMKTKYVPPSILLPGVLAGVVLGGALSVFKVSDRLSGVSVAIYGLGLFIVFRSLREKSIRKINLPADFVRRERFYDFAISLTFLFLVVVMFIF
jgi:hypothetical protein